MSYDPRLGAEAYGAADAYNDGGDARKGSVRAARERMQAAQKRTQLPDTSKIIGLPRRPNQNLPQSSIQQSPPTAFSASMENDDSGPPSPQWPLPNSMIETSIPIPPRSPRRLQSPPQVIRPVSDDLPIQQLSPDFQSPLSPGYLQASEDTFSPGSYRSSRPITTSSIASESSIGSIPDFPIPQPPMPSIQQTRRFPSLGPPPSSRRGPSSYYTQMSYVSPIVEESETHSTRIQSQRGSFASSNVFPTNNDSFYPEDDIYSDDDETISSERGTITPTDDRSGLVQQSPALVRQASLGRRTKPSIMTIKSVDSNGDKKSGAKKNAAGLGAGVGVAMGLGAATLAARDGTPIRGRSPLSSHTSSDSLDTFQNSRDQAGYATSTSSPHPLSQEMRFSGLAERAGMRRGRPATLDMDAVREAEARGSLTSLPDLIRRATRLAANLDRGRTASRLNMDFWENGAPNQNQARQSGLSEMLAAFPPPGQETPTRSGRISPRAVGGGGGLTKWPSTAEMRDGGLGSAALTNEKPKKRRCCGLPLWTFITLLIVLLFIIAAAVVIPVVLVVIPNQNKATSAAAQNTQGSSTTNGLTNTNVPASAPTSRPNNPGNAGNAQCDGIITCQNGGIAIFNADRSCNCICINGFTGRTCTNNDATGCTTTNIEGTANNATMGSGIPRLIEETAKGFDVPMNATRILSLFSTLSLSCAAENALITFNGLASRSLHSIDVRSTLHPSRTLPLLHHPHPAQALHQLHKRQTVGQSNKAPASPQQAASPQASATVQPISSSIVALDFARVAVLFALQQSSSLDIAAAAQESIQTLLTNNRNGNAGSTAVDVGPFKLDLAQFTIQFGNGTTIRAPPQSAS
ncbi:epidermal growth factor-like type 3 [Pyrenophora seminiperda CCB06]|uniref:Epidermal growth factor-like type 3 n=1 Tax=Pyrenophora seminiperda CCB06 TaxID=1302712 RepID=A0A3M7MC39_9PLEO|nr:epidermal growth factor-like type 3 [Pyrenophora seminiperda CCB06]